MTKIRIGSLIQMNEARQMRKWFVCISNGLNLIGIAVVKATTNGAQCTIRMKEA